MLTKNFYYLLSTLLTDIAAPSGKGMDGENFSLKREYVNNTTPYVMQQMVSGVKFSSDPTPPTVDDYKLPSSGSLFSVTGCTNVFRNFTNDGFEFGATYTVRNDLGHVAEVHSVFLTYRYRVPAGYERYLLDHTLLDEPITLQPGESKQITYTIRFNYPQPPAV